MVDRPPSDQVDIVECPRDAWQGLAGTIPSEVKAAYLRKLIEAGFKHIDAVSFVAHAAVPQMADSEKVLELLGSTGDAEIIGIVVNVKGAERAISTGRVQRLGFPYSISPEFLRRNQKQSPEAALEIVSAVHQLAKQVGIGMVVYVSMAFGNPYGDRWTVNSVLEACRAVADIGVSQISLADTVGLATALLIEQVLCRVYAARTGADIGVHLHARVSEAPEMIRAAYGAGCRRFDAAVGGLGGCPFAQDELVGNVPTEVLLRTLGDLHAAVPRLGPLDGLIESSERIAAKFGAAASDGRRKG